MIRVTPATPQRSAESAVTKPRKQEQERASDDVVEVAPGVLRCQLPIDMPGLGHVNCYVLEDERGVALVDPGLPGSATLKVLTSRLAGAGIPLKRVHTVVVTHSHPDHFGAAGRLRHETGADVVTHRLFHLFWDRHEPPDVGAEELADTTKASPWTVPPWGGERPKLPFKQRLWFTAARYLPRLARTPQPTRRLEDAGTIRLAGRDWIAVHTPGHTDDHLCLFDPSERVMLSGDHVLPTITPHIGGYVRDVDPLQRFFDSLDKVAEYGNAVDTVLPAHGHPFTDLAGRARGIRDHHRRRLELVRSTSDVVGRPMSVQEVSTFLYSPQAQGPMADSETFAHLEHLRRTGAYRRRQTRAGYRYEPA